MSEVNKNNNEKNKAQSQFDNELFFNYLNYFSNIRIEYVDILEKNFYDKENQILRITRNPSFEEVSSIIFTLDNEVWYNSWITAKSKLLNILSKYNKEQLKTNTALKLIYLKKKDGLENSLLIESLYEEWKKYILDTMEAPESSELLMDKLDISNLYKKFGNLSLKEQKKEINKILQVLYNYDEADNNQISWGLPMKFVKNKELYCVWFSYLADIIFEKLNITHNIATWIKKWKEKRAPHSVSILTLKNEEFIFDPAKALFLVKIDKIKNNSFKHKDYLFTIWNAETEVLAQNIWNFSNDIYNIDNRIKTLEYAYKLSKHNILILTDLTKIYKERYDLFKNHPIKSIFYKKKYTFYKNILSKIN